MKNQRLYIPCILSKCNHTSCRSHHDKKMVLNNVASDRFLYKRKICHSVVDRIDVFIICVKNQCRSVFKKQLK